MSNSSALSSAIIAKKYLLKSKEMIHFACQLADAICRNTIKPEFLEPKLIYPDLYSGSSFEIDVDWVNNPILFKETAEDAQIAIMSWALIVAKESYGPELWVTVDVNQEVYAAQVILQLIRNALAHMKATKEFEVNARWQIDRQYKNKVFEINRLGICLDTSDLDGLVFRPSHIGGLKAINNLLSFLHEDLENRFPALN